MKTRFSPEQLKDPRIIQAQSILEQCRHCGLCTATCSSYVILGDERASPRGRISLVKNMLEKGEKPSKSTMHFLDNCLGCLSCMTSCPSDVDYAHLLALAHSHAGRSARRPLSVRLTRSLLVRVLPYPGRLGTALRLARLIRPLRTPLSKLGLQTAARMLDILPPRHSASRHQEKRVPTGGRKTRRVAVFPGCSGDILRPSVNEATISLLTRMGVEVVTPSNQGCCGAVEQQLGETERAVDSAKRNVDLLSKLHADSPLDAIVTTGSGCGSMLKDYAFVLQDEPAYARRARDIADLARDITEVLDAITMTAPRQWSDIKVAYHGACSLEHGQQVKQQPRSLLTKAGFTVLETAEGHLCCGAAGTYRVLQPVISDALRTRKLDNINKAEPDIVASGSLDCITHLAARSPVPVVHTIELLNWAHGGNCPAELKHLEAHVNKISGVLASSHMDEFQ